MNIQVDTNGQTVIDWEPVPGCFKRAWIQRETDPAKDWAKPPDGRYLNIAQHPASGGNPTDFPVFCNQTDEEILVAFVVAVCRITGCRLL